MACPLPVPEGRPDELPRGQEDGPRPDQQEDDGGDQLRGEGACRDGCCPGGVEQLVDHS